MSRSGQITHSVIPLDRQDYISSRSLIHCHFQKASIGYILQKVAKRPKAIIALIEARASMF